MHISLQYSAKLKFWRFEILKTLIIYDINISILICRVKNIYTVNYFILQFSNLLQ